MTKRLRILLLFVFAMNVSFSQVLPPPSHDNSFFMLPLWEKHSGLSEELMREQMDKLITQCGEGNLYNQLGFSCIYTSFAEMSMRCKIAQEKGLRIGIVLANQTHTRSDLYSYLDQDYRVYQWRKNGELWKPLETNDNGSVIYPARDYKTFTPSRLCTHVRSKLVAIVSQKAKGILELMRMYPGVISVVNSTIEEELATGAESDDNYLADYSPYAVTEFRDWLRHTGMYDAETGEHPGEGALEAQVGAYIQIGDQLRSQFYDDPTPDNANGTGVSFNDYFNTAFTTWNLKYWDLELYPDAITSENFDLTPETGNGFTSGGFDAPRVIDASNSFWNVWSWDVLDHGGAYPSGDPSNPAFGFRQVMVKNYINDLLEAYINEGLPSDNLYPHQIPGEIVSADRLRSGADPIWTGLFDHNNNLGITRFGPISDITKITKYSSKWGIFEWHPLPYSTPDNQNLYNRAIYDLNYYYNNGCKVLFPGWWGATAGEIFPLNDSKFAEAIHDFMSTLGERPYGVTDAINYTPPQVIEPEVLAANATTHIVRWGQRMWEDYPETWRMWSGFDHFEVQQSTDKLNWTTISSTFSMSAVVANRTAGTDYFYRVRASSKAGLKGEWSDVATLIEYSNLVADVKYPILSAPDESIENRIVYELQDENGNQLPVETYASGGVFSREDTQLSKFLASYTNTNQAERPSDVNLMLNGAVVRNEGDEVKLQFTPPVNNTISAITFNYYCNYDNSIVSLLILDGDDNVIWENNKWGVTNGYQSINFETPVQSFSVALRMKKTTSAGNSWFANLSGISVKYATELIKDVNLLSYTVTGNGTAGKTRPVAFGNADIFVDFEGSADTYSPYQLTDIEQYSGLYTAKTAGNDPYFYVRLPQAVNGGENPYIYFRIYSSAAVSSSQIFWFNSDNVFYNKTFSLNKGWNIVELSNLPNWVNQTEITKFRIDPSTAAGLEFKIDWLVVDDSPWDGELSSIVEFEDNVAVLPTFSNGIPGEYHVDASVNSLNSSETIIVGANCKNEWEYDYDREGWWIAHSLSENTADGIMTLTLTGADPYMYSPDYLCLDADEVKKIQVRMQNMTSDNQATLYWISYDEPSVHRAQSFTIIPNDNGFTTYEIDLTNNSYWNGGIRRLRIDPSNGQSTGTVKVDFVKLYDVLSSVAECEIDLVENSHTCDGIGEINFIVDPLSSETVFSVDLDPQSSIFNKINLSVDLNDARSGWLVNIGDSESNNGYGGDSGHQSNDSEFQLLNSRGSVYGSDYTHDAIDGLRLLYYTDDILADNSLNIEVSNNSLKWSNQSANDILNSSYIFALNGQSDLSSGGVDYETYFAFNRTVASQYRNGSGVERVRVQLSYDPNVLKSSNDFSYDGINTALVLQDTLASNTLTEEAFKIYPNRVGEQLTVQLEGADVLGMSYEFVLIDDKGVEMLAVQLDEDISRIDLAGVHSGSYVGMVRKRGEVVYSTILFKND